MRVPKSQHRLLAVVFTAVFTLSLITIVHAVPPLLNYQGILLDAGGNPVSTTTSVEFGIWDAASSGNQLWTTTRSIAPDTIGRFNVLLGSLNPVPDSAFNSDAYLSIKVASDPEMTPRQRIVSVGYSYRVNSVDGALGGHITSDVVIGSGHTVSGTNVFVAGEDNENTGEWSSITGGRLHTITGGNDHIIGGGRLHLIQGGEFSTISGGLGSTIHDNSASVVSGGAANQIDSNGYWNVIAGGFGNRIKGNQYAVSIGGGILNRVGFSSTSSLQAHALAPGDTISGATIAGGSENEVTGNYATVAGGRRNRAAGYASFSAGSGASANHPGSFVWADSSDTMSSTGPNQFLIGASGGVGIGTDSPTEQLEVNGVIYSSAGGFRFPDNTVQTTAAGASASGWNDLGMIVVLTDSTNLVGIGTSNPLTTLDVAGEVNIDDKLRVGQLHTNSGANTFVAGLANHADGDFSVVAGGTQNTASAENASVLGGLGNTASEAFATVGGGFTNQATGNRATIAGGYGNNADGFAATIGGGMANVTLADKATVGGGSSNVASGMASTIPGGTANRARGANSFAAGSQAHASHDGAIVLYANSNDADTDSAYSTGPGQMVLRADSGFYMGDTQGGATIGPTHFLSTSTGAYLSKTGVWSNVSDADRKENFEEIDGAELLSRLANLPVTQWSFRGDHSGARHIGPTAQAFREAFGFGADDRHIATTDADGVALAAIKALHAENQQLKAELAELRQLFSKSLSTRR
ncbi:MAG: hypothetical protein Kow0074_04560 [Candidatus Zixiibacteriota bacterium]